MSEEHGDTADRWWSLPVERVDSHIGDGYGMNRFTTVPTG